MGGVADDVLLARAYLSRVAEPSSIPLWRDVRRYGPVEVATAIKAGTASAEVHRATVGRAPTVDPHADLAAAQRHGVRLLTPESDDWPHSAFAALEVAGLRRLARFEVGETKITYGGELMPPLALWVRGNGELRTLGYRSASIVGARSATAYGMRVAKDLAYDLAGLRFEIVSGGAYGIDAEAHRGALAGGGQTVIVSAGGVEMAYPPAHQRLFDEVAEAGLIVSECPPGCAPQRGRFLTRNRLIAALGTGTVVVEAAQRSGALNTATHCRDLGRVLMAVPGPVTSAMSVGCHNLLAGDRHSAHLVTGVGDVLELIGSSTDVCGTDRRAETDGEPAADAREALDGCARQVLEGFPARASISVDRLIVTSGVPPTDAIRTLPQLEQLGLISCERDGRYRLVRPSSAQNLKSVLETNAERHH